MRRAAKIAFGALVLVFVSVLSLAGLGNRILPASAVPCCLSVTTPTIINNTATVSFSIQDDLDLASPMAAPTSMVTLAASGGGVFFSGGTFLRGTGGVDCVPSGIGSLLLTYSNACIDGIDSKAPAPESIDNQFTTVLFLCTSPGAVTFTLSQAGASGANTITTNLTCVAATPISGGVGSAGAATVTITPSNGSIGSCGGSIIMAAAVKDVNNNNVPDGTPVNFVASSGTFTLIVGTTVATTVGGGVNVTYTAGPTTNGKVVITAGAGAALGYATVLVTCATPVPPSIPAAAGGAPAAAGGAPAAAGAAPAAAGGAPAAAGGAPAAAGGAPAAAGGAPAAAGASGAAAGASPAAAAPTSVPAAVSTPASAAAANIRPPLTGDGGLSSQHRASLLSTSFAVIAGVCLGGLAASHRRRTFR